MLDNSIAVTKYVHLHVTDATNSWEIGWFDSQCNSLKLDVDNSQAPRAWCHLSIWSVTIRTPSELRRLTRKRISRNGCWCQSQKVAAAFILGKQLSNQIGSSSSYLRTGIAWRETTSFVLVIGNVSKPLITWCNKRNSACHFFTRRHSYFQLFRAKPPFSPGGNNNRVCWRIWASLQLATATFGTGHLPFCDLTSEVHREHH